MAYGTSEKHVPTEANHRSRGHTIIGHGVVGERKGFVVCRREHSITKRYPEQMLSHSVNARTGGVFVINHQGALRAACVPVWLCGCKSCTASGRGSGFDIPAGVSCLAKRYIEYIW